ncbi:hypothetical protein Mal15_28210 [Stieleria maiorica]|uniref:Uncharacterized protein n=1 Tax=Stieleria maiorica TaxID=2795974 RepID=A0A5B9MGU9_9BACT|nr:hypothetical protein [Stieleria maiorica]QEF98765.1 hypothetical protein Mal15_28210 [Stieleria maiorica]
MINHNLRFALLATILWSMPSACMVGSAWAHEGPPFPILIDHSVANHTVSVWADPDIGEARFFIVVETRDGNRPSEAPKVSLWTEPTSGRLDRASYAAEQQPLRHSMQFFAEPYFDQRDFWNIGIRVSSTGGETEEIMVKVESTPPGYGAWDLAIYLFPFVLIGGAWSYAMAKRIRHYRESQQQQSDGMVESDEGPDHERHQEHALMEATR